MSYTSPHAPDRSRLKTQPSVLRSREAKMHTVPNQQSDPTSDGVQALEYNREHGDQEGQQHKDQRSHTLDSDQDVEYLYLNFDTTLPHPMGISSPQPGQGSPPPCPNLTKYASPFLWAESRKTVVTIISCCVTAMSAYAAGSYTPPADELTAKWNVSRVVYNLGISLYTLGFAIAPMVLAPFSEINGRRPIFVSSGLVFTGQLPYLRSLAYGGTKTNTFGW